MNDQWTVVYAIVAFAGLMFGYMGATYFMSPYRRRRFFKRCKCLLGKHEPGPVQDAVGGRRVQRCDWCDKIVRTYQVSVAEARKTPSITRIH